MKKSDIGRILLLCCLPFWISCSGRIEPTTVEIKDPVRHYYPILEGEELLISYDIRNTGKNPLVISEIQTSCGCITCQDAKRIVPPGHDERLVFRYDGSKNRGFVRHQIRLYGNFDMHSMELLEFDVHVVSPSEHGLDYEELYSRKERGDEPDNYYVDGEY